MGDCDLGGATKTFQGSLYHLQDALVSYYFFAEIQVVTFYQGDVTLEKKSANVFIRLGHDSELVHEFIRIEGFPA